MTTMLTGIPGPYSPYGPGSYLRFFDDETDTPKDVFSDADLNTVISNDSLVADATSRWPVIFMSPSLYRIKIYDADDVLKSTIDNFDPGLGAGFGVSSVVGIAQGGTGANNAAAALVNLGAAEATALSAAQTDITELQTQVATGLNGDDEFGSLAAEDDVGMAQLETGFGLIVRQEIRDDSPNANTTTTTTPAWDTSIPQVSEGTEIFSAAITPKSASNVIEIHCHLQLEATSAVLVAGLFLNSDANAIAASAATTYGAGVNPVELNIFYRVSAGSLTARTYSVRLGTSAGTVRVNASGGTGTLGGVMASFLSIKEIQTV